jgi:hypothetical protein
MDEFFKEHVSPRMKRLEIGDRKGWTDYIDFLKSDEITDALMGGYDCFQRPFFVIRWKSDSLSGMQVFFKRFPDIPDIWIAAKVEKETPLFELEGDLTKKHEIFFKNLLTCPPVAKVSFCLYDQLPHLKNISLI